MTASTLPFPPQYPVRGHHSLTNRGELLWFRSLAIAILAASLIGFTTFFDQLAQDNQDNTDLLLNELRDVENLITKTNSHLNTVSAKLTFIEEQIGAIDVSTGGILAVNTLIWRQFTNFQARYAEANIASSERDTVRNSLLTSIEASVQYEKETFRKRVRTALDGSTIIATTTLEVGGQCDIIPEECTLIGETESVVEDVTWLRELRELGRL